MQSKWFTTGRRPTVQILIQMSLLLMFSLCAVLYYSVVTCWHKRKLSVNFEPLSASEIALVKSKTGIYTEATKMGEFKNVILLTAGNFGYLDMYRNWACHAQRLGLKWLLVASDRQMYSLIGPDQAILSQNAATATSQAENFRAAGFNLITCSKLQDVLRVSISAKVDVVFSDCDNVFRSDPFALGASLGGAIRSSLYEYLYQHNEKQSTWMIEPFEGNTGFYYISACQKRAGFQNLYFRAVQSCQERPDIDDQTNFWKAFREMRSGTAHSLWRTRGKAFGHYGSPFKSATFCADTKISDTDTLSYCSLNASQHPVGLHDELSALVTYHANYRVGHDSKRERLKQLGLWIDKPCPF